MVRKNSAPSEQSWQILKDPELPPPSNITLPTNNHLHKLAVISPLGDCNHLLTGLNTPYHRFSPNHASHQRAGILASTNPIASWSQLHPGSPFLPTRGQTCMGIPHLEGPLPPFPREHLIIQFHHSPHFSDPFPDFNACEKAPPSKAQRGAQGPGWCSFVPLPDSCLSLLTPWETQEDCLLTTVSPELCSLPDIVLILNIYYTGNPSMPNPMEMTKGLEDWVQDRLQSWKPKQVHYSHKWVQRFYPFCLERKIKVKDRPNHRGARERQPE